MSLYQNKYRIESSRLKDWDYSNPWYYYVTINTENHVRFFGDIVREKMVLNDIGKIFNKEWFQTKQLRNNVELDYYVIMPNHLHGIVIINGPEVETHSAKADKRVRLPNDTVSTGDAFDASLRIVKNCLSDIIRGFKSSVTRQILKMDYSNFAWQTRFYDRIIRNEKELYKIRIYIEQNPLRWELEKNTPENLDI
jgi:putative transposase